MVTVGNELFATGFPFANGLVNSETGLAFIAHIPSGIDAIELTQGNVLWHSDRADRPLALWNSKLVAFKKTADTSLVVVVLDPNENGVVTFVSKPVTLPDWCSVAAENSPIFATTAKVFGGRLEMRIDAKGRYEGGANPSNEIVAKYSQKQSWLAEIDLRSGELKLNELDETAKTGWKNLRDSIVVGGKRLEIVAETNKESDSIDSSQRKLRALDPATGEILWQTPVGAVSAPRHPKLPQ